MSTSTNTHDVSQDPHAPLRIAVIVASVRDQRLGPLLAEWVTAQVGATTDVDVIDLADVDLPDDGLLRPGGGGPDSPIAGRIDDADGFVFVTPEYNHSFPAALKRAIDWHYGEWRVKPATVFSYGVHGGWLATEQLRSVLAELSVVMTRRTVGLQAPWMHLAGDGYDPGEGTTVAAKAAVDELLWWAAVLREARRAGDFPG